MKAGLTELVIIIDESGSMFGLENDVIGGYNKLIKDQKQIDGEVKVTTLFFADNYKEIYSRENIKKVKNLTTKDYIPSGCTALLDTLGYAINKIRDIHSKLDEKDIPEHVIFSIMTDGYENASKEYTLKHIKDLITMQQEKGWNFIYQAANIDAISEGNKMGINVDGIDKFDCSVNGLKMCFSTISKKVMAERCPRKPKNISKIKH